MNKISELLVNAKTIIDTPEKWCKGILHDGTTGAFCSLGAVLEATREYYINGEFAFRDALLIRMEYYMERALNQMGWRYPVISSFNDLVTTSHSDVMEMFDKAIIAAERN